MRLQPWREHGERFDRCLDDDERLYLERDSSDNASGDAHGVSQSGIRTTVQM